MIVGTLAGGAHPSGFNSRDAHRGNLVVEPQTLAVAHSLSAHHGRLDLDNQTYVTIPDVAYALADATGSRTGTGRDAQDTFIFEPRYARNGRGAPDTIAPPLKAQNGGTGKGDGAPVVAQPLRAGRQYSDMGDGQSNVVVAAMHETGHLPGGVRRLTPTECERLQGFPDGHTAGQSDSARYRQLGNAVAVPVARWIGTRIMEVLS
jgi:DNA (cytosine-5)-methyltransferase 1